MPHKLLVNRASRRIVEKYRRPGTDWILAFSGGKDSTAVLLSTIAALRVSTYKNRLITVVFCDTGVENPLITKYVNVVFKRIRYIRKKEALPIKCAIVKPALKNTFWVKVIGRGCPPPTNRFRWCTDKLRVNPIRDYIRSKGLDEALTLTGIRKEESQQRNRAIEKYTTSDEWILKYYDANQRKYFCPILDFSEAEVWELLRHENLGEKNWLHYLESVYGTGNGESNNGKELRTGCWICTVVRRDRSAEQLLRLGHGIFQHLMEYRDWLSDFRDNSSYRCTKRRNGMRGPGPVTLKGREIILNKLIYLQRRIGIELITKVELDEIQRLWTLDKMDPRYHSIIEG